jgi:hypothetical protein
VYSSRIIRYTTSLLNRHNISDPTVYGAVHYNPKRQRGISVIAGFRREADVNCALLGYYAASSGNSSPMSRDKLSHIQGPSNIRSLLWIVWPFRMGTIGFFPKRL